MPNTWAPCIRRDQMEVHFKVPSVHCDYWMIRLNFLLCFTASLERDSEIPFAPLALSQRNPEPDVRWEICSCYLLLCSHLHLQHHQEAQWYPRKYMSAVFWRGLQSRLAHHKHIYFLPSGRNHSLPRVNLYSFRRIDWTRKWKQEVNLENILKQSGSILPPHSKTMFDFHHKIS